MKRAESMIVTDSLNIVYFALNCNTPMLNGLGTLLLDINYIVAIFSPRHIHNFASMWVFKKKSY